MADVCANTYTPPEWLDQKFLQDALREGLRRGSLQLLDCDICPATNKGDNFISQMFRASTRIGSKRRGSENLSIVIKSLPRGDHVEKFVRESRLFEKETMMLSKTLPSLHQVLEYANLPALFAKLVFQQGPPNDLLILEDLCQDGFKAADRLAGLDLAHCILAVEALATFHAASIEAIDEDPEIKERHDKGLWHPENEQLLKKFVTEGMKSLEGQVSNLEGLPENFSETLIDFEEVVMKKIFDTTIRQEAGFNVLTHGDAWTNNFMFKYLKGSPVAIKLVDFQISNYNNPVLDLLYFFFTSPNDDIKVKEFDTLLRTYLEKLHEVCNKLQRPLVYTFENLKADFLNRIAFGFAVAVTVFPFTTAEGLQVVELDDFLNETPAAPNNQQFQTKRYHDGMKIMLPYFIENGLFD